MSAQSTSYDALIRDVSNVYQLPFDLLRAQVIAESGGDACAFRYEPEFFRRYIRDDAGTPQNEHPRAAAQAYGPLAACSYGLLQILLETAVEIGYDGKPWELFQPRVGLAWGAKRMQGLWLAAGHRDADYPVALGAYNGGPALLHVPPTNWPTGPKTYVDRIYALAGRTR